MLRGIVKSTNAAVATCLFRTGMACIYLGDVLTHRGEATFGEWWNNHLADDVSQTNRDFINDARAVAGIEAFELRRITAKQHPIGQEKQA